MSVWARWLLSLVLCATTHHAGALHPSKALPVVGPVRAPAALNTRLHKRAAADSNAPGATPHLAVAAIYVHPGLQSTMLVRHLVAYAASLQRLNYTVDVLSPSIKERLSLLQLLEYGNNHGLPLQPSTIAFQPVKMIGTRLYTLAKYALFVSLADDGVPPYLGAGILNVHVCVACVHEHSVMPSKMFTLPSYDVVFTPSTDAYERYIIQTEDMLVASVRNGVLIPQIFSLVPPFNTSANKNAAAADTALDGHFVENDSVDLQNTQMLFSFTTALGNIIRHAQAAQPLRKAMHRVGNTQKPARIASQSSKMAVCIEWRHHYALRASVISVMSHLPSWSLTVFHGTSNARFVDDVLIDMPEIELKQLPFKILTTANYSALIASFGFWSRVHAETVFLFSAGTLLTGNMESLLQVPIVVPDVVRREDGLQLGLPAADGGVHASALVDVKKAKAGLDASETAWAAFCTVSADGECYERQKKEDAAVAITATACVRNDARLRMMIGAALNVSADGLASSTVTHRLSDPLSWSTYTSSADAPKTAALYTPYNIVYGGGESYLLQSAATLQSFGYDVDIIVDPGNVAKTVDDVMRVAAGLRVGIKRQGLRLLHVAHSGDTLEMSPRQYSVFYLLGNEKVPLLRGIGLVNLYMCQFPFDLDGYTEQSRIRTLATYDYVLVNSHFTYAHYAKYASSLYEAALNADLLVPQIELLHPPVQPFAETHKSHPRHRHIVLLGRMFMARQNKGQHVAIAAFKALQGRLPKDVRLLLIGNAMPGHDHYVKQLRHKAAGLNVDIITGQSEGRVLQLMQTALVQWHMTGADLVSSDPASYEHFGMAVVEGMSVGCLPVVLKRGGLVDIVHHGVDGFLADDVDDLIEQTAAIYKLPKVDRQQMVEAAQVKAAQFSPAEFTRKFQVILHRAFLTHPFRHAIQHGAPLLRARTPVAASRSTTNVAVLIEPRQHYALRFCTLNVVMHLPRMQWGLHVFHGATNGRFVRVALADVGNVRYTRLPYVIMTIPQYNDLLKNEAFWMSLQADNVLLFQTDSLLLGTNVGDFVGRHDYIGAPWHAENERWSVMRDILGPEGVGNGGLSLRTTASALDIIKRHGAASNGTEHEDVFFVKHIVSGDEYRMAPRQLAYDFCLEVPCVDLNALDTPFAVHAAWYYNEDARLQSLLNKALPPVA